MDSASRAAGTAQALSTAVGPFTAEIIALDYHDLVAGKDLTKDIARGPRNRPCSTLPLFSS
jgi:hypothetical protein